MMKREAERPSRTRRSAVIPSVGVLILLLAVAGACTAGEPGPDPAKIREGSLLYRHFCASCHGAGGHGDGPVAELLTVKPTDLTQLARDNGGEFPFEKIVKIIDGRQKVGPHGTEMPVWGDAFQKVDPGGDEEAVRQKIEALVHFLGSIQAEQGS